MTSGHRSWRTHGYEHPTHDSSTPEIGYITQKTCLDSQKGDEIPIVTIMHFKKLANYLRLQNRINILFISSTDIHLQEERIKRE